MQSALWAGKRRAGQPARISLSVGFGQTEAVEYSYEVEAGLTSPCVPR